MQQLLARRFIVPFAIALDNLEQAIGGGVTLAPGVQRQRQIEARLIVGGIIGHRLFQRRDIAKLGRLFGDVDRGEHRGDRRVRVLAGGRGRSERQHALGLFEIARVDVQFGEAGNGLEIGFVLGQHLRIEFRGACLLYTSPSPRD